MVILPRGLAKHQNFFVFCYSCLVWTVCESRMGGEYWHTLGQKDQSRHIEKNIMARGGRREDVHWDLSSSSPLSCGLYIHCSTQSWEQICEVESMTILKYGKWAQRGWKTCPSSPSFINKRENQHLNLGLAGFKVHTFQRLLRVMPWITSGNFRAYR